MAYRDHTPERIERALQTHPAGLTSRVWQFFKNNREEELDRLTIMQKFDASRANADYTLKRLKGAGLVESVHVVRVKR